MGPMQIVDHSKASINNQMFVVCKSAVSFLGASILYGLRTSTNRWSQSYTYDAINQIWQLKLEIKKQILV